MQVAEPTPLSQQVAVVTGAGRGIGLAIALRLAEMGARVILTARNEAHLRDAARQIHAHGGHAEPFACDVADLENVRRLAQHVRQNHQRVDILVNNAGVGGPPGPLHDLTPQDWDLILNTNLRGVFHTIREFAPLMIARSAGHIVNISSLAGKNPLPRGAAYAASKWGLNGLSYSVAEELRAHNIRVSVICPGSVDTGFSQRGNQDPQKKLKPEDVAHAVAMVVTEAPQSFISEILIRPTAKL